ncbi:MAG: metallophosphoesterase, partial [Clostridia bacterium]|nr:metallophosphoesterase [Clostridia bacterium]
MKIFKKITALVLSLIILTGAGICAFAADADNGAAAEEFIPVLRFIASSDTHILSYSDRNDKRIGMMLDLAYEISEADPNYKALDALLVAGDLTNDGTKEEFDRFAAAVKGSIREGTEFIGVVAKNHDGYEMRRSELRDYYKKETGSDADFNIVINGYHFIGLSASSSDAAHYDAKQLSWLDEQIKQAVSEDPDKPVFVTHHEHNSNTVYGSSTFEGWGVPYFNP